GSTPEVDDGWQIAAAAPGTIVGTVRYYLNPVSSPEEGAQTQLYFYPQNADGPNAAMPGGGSVTVGSSPAFNGGSAYPAPAVCWSVNSTAVADDDFGGAVGGNMATGRGENARTTPGVTFQTNSFVLTAGSDEEGDSSSFVGRNSGQSPMAQPAMVKAEGGGMKAEGGGMKAEGGGMMAEGGGMMAEGGGMKAEGGGMKAEGGGMKASWVPSQVTTVWPGACPHPALSRSERGPAGLLPWRPGGDSRSFAGRNWGQSPTVHAYEGNSPNFVGQNLGQSPAASWAECLWAVETTTNGGRDHSTAADAVLAGWQLPATPPA
ncbi:MAG: hypothetical protein ABSF26_30970, partial [Thermoguttaceae bacterium]